MTESPEQQVIDLIETNSQAKVEILEHLFGGLRPVTVNQLIGKWKGSYFNTGHPELEGDRPEIKTWAGKDFHSVDDVDPIVLYDDYGNRKASSDFGKARVREVKYRGVVSAAMIYDAIPIIDVFRYVRPDLVIGVMDRKGDPNTGTLYFHLTKLA